MAADPSFGAVGLALLPFIFFYISTKLSEEYRFLVIFFFSLGILTAFMALATVGQVMGPPISDGLTWLGYSAIILWVLYLLFELLNLGIGTLLKVLPGGKGKIMPGQGGRNS